MASFDGRLRLPGRTRIPVSVVVDITDERLKCSSGEKSLGDWPLDQLTVVSLPDGFHLTAEDEEIVLTVSDPDTFFGMLRDAKGSLAPEPAPLRGSNVNGTISSRLRSTDPEEEYSELRAAVDTLAEAMGDDSIPPDRVFAAWLRLLKELNHRHGRGSMPTPVFYRLNTEMLDLMPVADAEA